MRRDSMQRGTQIAGLLAILCGLAAAQEASDQRFPVWLKVTVKEDVSLNVRAFPDKNSMVVDRVQRGDILRATGERFGFYEIVPPEGSIVMVAADFILPEEDGATGVVNTASGGLRMRAGSTVEAWSHTDPGGNTVVGTLQRGARVEIVGEQTDSGGRKWYRIKPSREARFWVQGDYVERITDAAAKAAGAADPLEQPTKPSASTPSRDKQPTTGPMAAPADGATDGDDQVPAGSESAGDEPGEAETDANTWIHKLTGLERAIYDEDAKPLLEQDWEPIVAELRRVAAQDVAVVAARRATGWIEQIAKRREKIAKAREIHERMSGVETRLAADREEIRRRTAEQQPLFDAKGQLLPSYTAALGEFGLRYLLRDPLTETLVCYVEFPPALHARVPEALGRYVGVRGVEYEDEKLKARVIRVTGLNVLHADTTVPRRSQPTGQQRPPTRQPEPDEGRGT